jgi:glutamate dehydrogenase (NAD(P)+)
MVKHGTIKGYPGATFVQDGAAVLEEPCDILIPAALEGVIHKDNAARIRAPLIIEAANGPVTFSADEILRQKGTVIIPDMYANAGGVTVSYFEWVQDFSSFFWTEDEINVRLDKVMINALKRIWDTADRHRVTLRTATFAVACERILRARAERGLYP